ncbi:T9SS type A sorting domain-containing protein [Dyadobacter sp. CY347]|uniref:T9SS type A sorting domain-containing protein n=1 Tax=Dyadobacter sp. CY347 TaxID=2909336 RepID=UPI001F394793|nr:T9SS type A sorting domain-containing protein [Dyadobacter sp. CY347]MCF2489882.1 T9SS type A sorting domain-containing protein [Dyadobacter sp. CY347]
MKKFLAGLTVVAIQLTVHCIAQIKYTPVDSVKSIGNPVLSLTSQEHIPQPPKTVQSPNAATLGSYGEIAVSPYTGKANISIDLYSITDGNVEIPVTLHYDATGVRPDVHPGWVGLNFGLSTNYSITRTVKDGYDEYIPVPGIPDQLGFMNTGSVINGNDWATPAKIKQTALVISQQTNTFVDTEPDEYSFNAPGLSGKFYRGSDGKWKVQCDRPVKVETIAAPNVHLYTPFTAPASIKDGNPWSAQNQGRYMEHFQGFTVTDEYGTQYIFGGSDMAYMEYSIDFFEQGKDTWICNAWYLKSIVRHTGQTIHFTYERGDFVNQMYFSVYNKKSRIDGGWWFACDNWSSLIGQYGPYTGKLISPIYPKEISGDNFKIKFQSSESTELRYTNDIFTSFETKKTLDGYTKLDYLTFLFDCYYPSPANYPNGCGSPTLTQLLTKLKWRKLDKIQVQNGSGATIKEFEFTYNNIITERLMLQKVQEKSGYSAAKLPPYEFTYFTKGFTLPGYGKSHTDHWGYNNGKLINAPNDFNAMAAYGTTFRIPAVDDDLHRVGSLMQIKYPTGGITKFRFEPHRFSKEVKLKRWEGEDAFGVNQVAGGLRIKEIHSYDPTLPIPSVVKKYYYLSAFDPASPDTSASALSSGVLGGKAQYYWPNYKPLPDNSGISVEEEIFSTQSVLPASENSMGSHIGYSRVIERSSTEGWIVHQFSNFDNGYRDEAPLGFLQPSTTPYQPYNSKAFMRGKPLSEERYFQNGSVASKTTNLYSLVGAVTDYTARSVKTQFTVLCNTSNSVFEGTAYVIDCRKFLPAEVANYYYDQENGTGAPALQSFTYWPNGQLYISGQSDSKGRTIKTWYKYPANFADAVSLEMVSKNIIGPVLETFKYTGMEAAPMPIKKTAVTYDLFSGFYRPQKVQTKLFNAAAFNTDIEFLTYDARGNLLTYKQQNGLVNKLEYYGPADVGKADMLKKSTVADGATISQSAMYNYKAAIGVESMQDANGKVVAYEYDLFNRLKNQRSGNAAGPTRVSYCYNHAGQVVDCPNINVTGAVAAPALVLIAESALPVTLVEFLATAHEKQADLTWMTTAETNSERFDIERSSDGGHWQLIGSVPSHRESSEQQSYSFVDLYPLSGENLYRLKMIDMDGTFTFSRIRNVVFGEESQVTLYPNPLTVTDALSIETGAPEKIAGIFIYDVNGKQMLQTSWKPSIDIKSMSAGLYLLQITYTDGSVSSHRIVKQ